MRVCRGIGVCLAWFGFDFVFAFQFVFLDFWIVRILDSHF